VFKRGTVNGDETRMPAGGQTEPTSMAGLKEKWKKDQNQETKKKISLTMKRAKPIKCSLRTREV